MQTEIQVEQESSIFMHQKSSLLVLLPSHAAALGQSQRSSFLSGFGDMGQGNNAWFMVSREKQPLHLRAQIFRRNIKPGLNSYKTQQPPQVGITLPCSNRKAGCANSVHNPLSALSNKHKNLSEQAGTASQVKTVPTCFPRVPNNTGNNPAFVIHNFHTPGWAICWDGNGMDNFLLLSSGWNPIKVNKNCFHQPIAKVQPKQVYFSCWQLLL